MTGSYGPENFLARVKRVSSYDAIWLRAHHYALEPVILDHFEDKLTDEHLKVSLERASRGLIVERQPR